MGFHVDDSFLTINLCLNDSFKGSELVFEGTRCPRHIETPAADSERTCIDHKRGYIVFHHGKNRHYVKGIEDGRDTTSSYGARTAQSILAGSMPLELERASNFATIPPNIHLQSGITPGHNGALGIFFHQFGVTNDVRNEYCCKSFFHFPIISGKM